jgi:hypothetical protein
MNSLKNFLYQRSSLMVLSFLTKHMKSAWTLQDISDACVLSDEQSLKVLDDFCEKGIISCKMENDIRKFELKEELLYVQAFRMFEDAVELSALVATIKERCRKIVLLDKTKDDDGRYDEAVYLFIEMDQDNHRFILDAISKAQFDRPIRPIVLSTHEILQLTIDNPTYIYQLNAGIVLWNR